MVTGAIIITSRLGSNLQNEVQMMNLVHITYEIEDANKYYFGNHSPLAKVQSLEHVVKYLEHVCSADAEAKCENAVYYDMTTFYVRLGMLYEMSGKLEMASPSFAKAFQLANEKGLFEKWRATEKEVKTVEDLKRYVKGKDKKLQ